MNPRSNNSDLTSSVVLHKADGQNENNLVGASGIPPPKRNTNHPENSELLMTAAAALTSLTRQGVENALSNENRMIARGNTGLASAMMNASFHQGLQNPGMGMMPQQRKGPRQKATRFPVKVSTAPVTIRLYHL